MDWKVVQLKESFKDRLEVEYPNLDDSIKLVLYFFIGTVEMLWGKRLTITTIFRTATEEAEIYDDGRKSWHQYYLALDFRFSPLSPNQWAQLKVWAMILFKEFGLKMIIHEPDNSDGIVPHVHVELHKRYKEVSNV